MNPEPSDHIARAEGFLHSAEQLFKMEFWADSVSRSYYAVFHAATAALLNQGIVRRSHHAIWSAFGEHFAATGRMDQRLHRYALDIFEARNLSDYSAKSWTTREDAEESLQNARLFVAAAKTFIDEHSH